MGQVAAVGACVLALGWRTPWGIPRFDQFHAVCLAGAWVWIWLGTRARIAWPSAWLIAWALPLAVIYRDSWGIGWAWIGVWTVGISACGLLLREPAAVRRAMRWCAVAQLPLMALELVGRSPYERAGGGLAGSLAVRYLASMLFGVCSLWSTGWKAWAWAVGAVMTGSVIGVVPSGGRLLWQAPRRWRLTLFAVGLLGVLGWSWQRPDQTMRYVTSRLEGRAQVVQGVLRHPWPPVGFGTLRAPAFTEDSSLARFLGWRDYHSGLLESWARFGPYGVGILVAILGWCFARSGVWVGVWASLALVGQSLEAYPAIAWLVAMGLIGGRDGLDTVSQTVRVS